jgi:hypothetical protein
MDEFMDDEALARKLQEEEDLAIVSETIAQVDTKEKEERESRPRLRQPDPHSLADDNITMSANIGSLLGSFQSSFQSHLANTSSPGRLHAASTFHRKYQAYSLLVAGVSNIESDTFEHGDKILLPASALQELSGRDLLHRSEDGSDPILFRLSVKRLNDCSPSCCAAVLEFSSPHGCAVVPTWMMAHLGVEDGDAISVQQLKLPRATYCKLRPVNFSDFKKLESHRAVLEATLRSFFTLTRGSTISVLFDGVEFIFQVVDLDPVDGESACILNADLETEFDLPEEYFASDDASPPLPPVAAVVPSSVPSSSSSSSSGVALGESSAVHSLEGHLRCKLCKRLVPEASYSRHQAFCARNVWTCPDCGSRMPPSERAAHVTSAHTPLPCPACSQPVIADLLATHQLFECLKRRVLCPFCELSFEASKSDAHEQTCGSRTEKCANCGAYVMMRYLSKHEESGCSFRAPVSSSISRHRLHVCHFCGVDYDDIGQLAVHLTAHEDAAPLEQRNRADDGEDRFRADVSDESMGDLSDQNSPRELSLSLSQSDEEGE